MIASRSDPTSQARLAMTSRCTATDNGSISSCSCNRVVRLARRNNSNPGTYMSVSTVMLTSIGSEIGVAMTPPNTHASWNSVS